MAKAKGYELIPRPVPTRRRASIYKEIIAEFIASGHDSAQVVCPDRKPVTLLQGLRKAVVAEDLPELKVVQRGSDIYLVKE